jgi:hypothetical protein
VTLYYMLSTIGNKSSMNTRRDVADTYIGRYSTSAVAVSMNVA